MGQRLLVVDNDKAFLDEHRTALEAAFEVEFMSSTEGAMPRLELGGICTVLICVEVTENKGYALCSAIRRTPALQDLKVVLISAKATEEEYSRHQSLKGRADLYLHKPMEPGALVASLSPLVPPRSTPPEDFLSELDGTDLGEEWLESLKSELEVDFEPLPPTDAGTTRVLPPAELEHRVAELEDMLATRTRELESLSSRLGDLDRLQSLEGAHSAAEAELTRVRESLALSQERIQELECRDAGTSSEETDRQIRLLKQDVAGLEGTLRGQRRELAEQGIRLQDLEAESQDLKARTETAEQRSNELESQLAEARQESGDLKAELEQTRRQLEEKSSLLTQTESRADELEVRGVELQAKLEETEAERRVCAGDLETSQGRLSQTETELAEKSTLVLRLEQELAAMSEQFEAARSVRDRQAEELSALQQQLEEAWATRDRLSSEGDTLRSELEKSRAEAQSSQALLEQAAAERDRFQADHKALEERLAQEGRDHEAQRTELLAGIDERESALMDLRVQLSTLETRSAALESEKRELEGHLNERSARLDSLTGVISDLEAGIRRASDLTRPF
nr:response regulator [uncultured Holophaga sp.]